MPSDYPTSFIDSVANVIYYQNAKLLTAIAEEYKLDKEQILNEFLISAQDFKNDIINPENCNVSSKKKQEKKLKVIEWEDTEYYWDINNGNVYYSSNPDKLAGKINKEGDLLLYY